MKTQKTFENPEIKTAFSAIGLSPNYKEKMLDGVNSKIAEKVSADSAIKASAQSKFKVKSSNKFKELIPLACSLAIIIGGCVFSYVALSNNNGDLFASNPDNEVEAYYDDMQNERTSNPPEALTENENLEAPEVLDAILPPLTESARTDVLEDYTAIRAEQIYNDVADGEEWSDNLIDIYGSPEKLAKFFNGSQVFSGDYAYWFLEELGGVEIVRYYGDDEYVIIPEEIDGFKVVSIYNYAFAGLDAIEITIPDCVIEINSSAFANCEKAVKITLSENLKIIPQSAFFGCDLLEELIIPESVTEIEKEAFWGCESLKTMVIPDNVASIHKTAFLACSMELTVEYKGETYVMTDNDYQLDNMENSFYEAING